MLVYASKWLCCVYLLFGLAISLVLLTALLASALRIQCEFFLAHDEYGIVLHLYYLQF
jgi:hypothetical protein